MSGRATIGIVIPAYNAERYLARTVEGVIAQSKVDWQLVIVDDGSRDGTRAIAERYAAQDSRIRLIAQANGGVAAARNRGIAASDPAIPYIIFLDNDDFWEPDALARLHAALEAHPAAPAAHALAQDVDADGRPLTGDIASPEERAFGYRRRGLAGRRMVAWPIESPTSFAVLVVWDCIETTGQVLIRRAALDAAGHFDPATVPSDDWDLWLRLSLCGDLVFLPEIVLNKRQHNASLSRQSKAMRGAELAIRRKLAAMPALSAEQRRIARLGHFHACTARLSWARASWSEGRRVQALKQVRQALLAGVQFLRTSYRESSTRRDGQPKR